MSWYIVTVTVLVAAFLLGLAAVLLLFGHTSDTLYYLLIDLTFLSLQVLIVTLLLDRLLAVRKRNELGQKLRHHEETPGVLPILDRLPLRGP